MLILEHKSYLVPHLLMCFHFPSDALCLGTFHSRLKLHFAECLIVVLSFNILLISKKQSISHKLIYFPVLVFYLPPPILIQFSLALPSQFSCISQSTTLPPSPIFHPLPIHPPPSFPLLLCSLPWPTFPPAIQGLHFLLILHLILHPLLFCHLLLFHLFNLLSLQEKFCVQFSLIVVPLSIVMPADDC